MRTQHFDTLIIGAGLSGIGTACHLMRDCPDTDFAILERRQQIGGTWDLFRYPGVRSDSDMFSFGFSFRPWNGLKTMADGESIRRYIEDTAAEYHVTDKIHFGVNLNEANWDSVQQRWQLLGECSSPTEEGGKALIEPVLFTCNVLISCTGYYDYQAGYQPEFIGMENFQGQWIHPQHWPQDLDYQNKRVVVIGSGATAVTLVPAMAEQAAHVTMLQRSPTYVLSVPAEDKLTHWLKQWIPERWAYGMARRRNITLHRWMFKAAKRWPQLVRKLMLRGVRKALDEGEITAHFTPRYAPWDQRLCAIPDGDLFESINRGKASVVTEEIDCITESGVRLKNGEHLSADIIVSATGLKLQLLGGLALKLDGESVDTRNRLTYKGVLMESVPNMAWVFGYTNAAWTLKADLAAGYICRLLNHLRDTGQRQFIAVDKDGCMGDSSVMSALQSGYVERADHLLPRQGTRYPWKLLNDYPKDRKLMLEAPIDDGILNFSATRVAQNHSAEEEAAPTG
ncbi:flavin-containing monooxygenase [Microbulbifer agarilyticus]|uniref:flavin-containing monooxygenase n=1 Tax=Microbulbifer agarilyticus TaxID=260552 RepID=UPI0021BBBAA5|nr:NAD(P)/FAD-dependent oxidoreductase [Microbulbifer agarilyticus]